MRMLFARTACVWKEFFSMKKWLCMLLALMVGTGWAYAAPLETEIPLELTSPAAMLVEAETGTVRWPV